ncbi:MAG: amidophosphoribosyltransferase [Mariprofundaceae bacterium]|nr:amidophosphoribosyltransferase [Mariprofundaceae bacterium]
MTLGKIDDDHFHDECGVFGVFNRKESSNLVYLGLYALQHRGQESAGIVSTDGTTFHSHRDMGLVADVFKKRDIARLRGKHSIGHVRYSTSGESDTRNCQPFTFEYVHGGISMCHNGNIINAASLRTELEKAGSIFNSTSDTEVFMHLIARSSGKTTQERVSEAAQPLRGAFSVLLLTEDKMIGLRDPNGIRPLVLAKLEDGWILSSETCALDLIGAEYIRDVAPGEMVLIDNNGVQSFFPFEQKAEKRFCVFEYIYFARPDSTLENINVYQARYNIGCELARESQVDADIVVAIPDSGTPPAIGYANISGIPFHQGLIRNHYVGRTFIEPKQSIRHFGVKLKLNASRTLIKGKRIVLVDDSIVRGTTSRKIVEMVRQAGAKEVHMRISSPPTKHSCFYGINTPDESELLANNKTLEEMCTDIGADSLAFISFDGLYRAVGQSRDSHCDACFSGNYPVPLNQRTECKQSVLKFYNKGTQHE